MTQAEFVTQIYEVALESNPDLDQASSFQDVIKQLRTIKEQAMRWEILVSSFKPEPELFPIKERRQGQL